MQETQRTMSIKAEQSVCKWESIYNGCVAARQGDHMTQVYLSCPIFAAEQSEVPGAVTVHKVHIW